MISVLVKCLMVSHSGKDNMPKKPVVYGTPDGSSFVDDDDGGGVPNLQAVTDVGNTTTNDLIATAFRSPPSTHATHWRGTDNGDGTSRLDVVVDGSGYIQIEGENANTMVGEGADQWPNANNRSQVTVVGPSKGTIIGGDPAGFDAAGLMIGDVAGQPLIRASVRATDALVSGAIAAGASVSQLIAVPFAPILGANEGCEVIVGGPATLEDGIILFAHVSAPGVVKLTIHNASLAPIVVAAGQLVGVRVFAWQTI